MRRYWLKNLIARRQTFGDYYNLMRELEAENPEDFQVYTSICSPPCFESSCTGLSPESPK